MVLPPAPPGPPPKQTHPFDFHGMPVQEAYRHLNEYQRRVSPEQLMATKLEIMRPYKTRNMAVGGGLIAFVLGVYVYSMYKTGHDDFDTVPLPRPPSTPNASKPV
ncbi:hypothetical protein PhCBS80983_g04962 [Powellomyces hirtus]|uniref:Cytochrome c oxidase assembly factor 3 mitochondrial coiled-coil domain-containing protein n=1 Tax=Powellomyces hirtus TaxID=109895 RepID=A0A507DY12_9FUNG|nr:hypothetical protein PhCBS80983_g04962 [Powellomyces hirtus]